MSIEVTYQPHATSIRKEIAERVLARRGRYHWFETINAKKTALVVIDMQNTFCAIGGPGEVPASRTIVSSINEFTNELRQLGVPIIWVLHANSKIAGRSDWEIFYEHIVEGEIREKTLVSNAPENQKVWEGLKPKEGDITLFKNRYSAFIAGSSNLERVLRGAGIDTILIAGTKTNVCCESTARDGMMLDFKIVMVSDCCAALSDDEHRSALENIIQQFGDVMTRTEVLERMRKSNEK